MWEPGLPAMGVYQPIIGWLIHRHRRQARLPQWFVLAWSQAACWNCCLYWFGDNSVCCLNNRAKKLASS